MNFDLYLSVQTLKGPGLKPEAFDPPVHPDALRSTPITPKFGSWTGSESQPDARQPSSAPPTGTEDSGTR
jgi:hypothetical protein